MIDRIRGHLRRTVSKQFGCRFVRLQNRAPIITFTFDDFPASALTVGSPMLKEYGAGGTYYASFGLMGKTESPVGRLFSAGQLQEVFADGHELGCHTYGHCDAWQTTTGTFEESVVQNRRRLEELMPGKAFATLSYPINEPRPQTKRRMQRHFSSCRAGGQTFNIGKTDLNNVRAFFLEQSGGSVDLPKELIDRTCAAGGWLVFATHDIAHNPTRFGVTPEFFAEVVRHAASSGARLLPMSKAVAVVRGAAS